MYKGMNLCIDIGNSSSKVGVFENSELKHYFLFENTIKNNDIALICNEHSISGCILSSTATPDAGSVEFLQTQVPFFIELTHQTPIPITNCYQTPETLGRDRLAAVVGAAFLKPHSDILVIDAGTAITFDFIDREKNYCGGTISPGLKMRFAALNASTTHLPLVQIAENRNFQLTGNNTVNAIIYGVANGILFEIDSYIAAFKEKYTDISVFLTGGDANFMAKRLKNSVCVEKFLVLKGLNKILEFAGNSN
ncbi:MAG: type III pantothenate kinase [Prevotellaceae bacterium]|jgi:type III pantothenate kinase|nr:type III pantothenate kinase [Prevotellaceae bacterium]